MAQPLVTILLPTIGRLEYFGLTRASLDAQTHRNYEVVVLDNASPPDAVEAFAEWARSDPRVRVARSSERLPMFQNFARGIGEVRGEYVVYCHDDDEYAPAFLASLVQTLEEHSSAGFSGSNWDFIDEAGEVTERRRWVSRTELWKGREYIRRLMRAARNPIPMPGVMYRPQVLKGGFDPTISLHFGDFVILMRMAERCDVVVAAEPLLRIRRHRTQASVSLPLSTAIRMRTELLARYCDEYAARWPEERAFVRTMRANLRRAHRIGAIWGWISSGDVDEAEACLDLLDAAPLDFAARRLLQSASRLGLSPGRRKHMLANVARRLGNVLKV
jgi:glycosyltransferase involved in cell wall biosynthesis